MKNHEVRLNSTMNKVDYRKELEKIAGSVSGEFPRLLIHSCCAPCSSYCLIYLRKWFDITSLYYNPNITDRAEYDKRVDELKRLVRLLNEDKKLSPEWFDTKSGTYIYEPGTAGTREGDLLKTLGRKTDTVRDISIIEGDYEPGRFYDMARGLEDAPEGGARCCACYAQRLRRTAELAAEGGYDYFSTTLTISPLKNAGVLNEIGYSLAREYNVKWLPSDFKKGEGYRQSIILSRKFDLYRQNYCGCEFGRYNQEEHT